MEYRYQKLETKITSTNSLCDVYLQLMEHTESPLIYHRWSFLSAVGAILSRNVWLPFGNSNIYANQFVILTGQPGARKNSAIDPVRVFLQESGYEHTINSKSPIERFFTDWEYGFDRINRGEDAEDKKNTRKIDGESFLDSFGGLEFSEYKNKISQAYVIAPELQAFLGRNKSEFIPVLTDLWDNLEKHADRYQNKKNIYIPNPTISLLGGTTPTTFAKMFSDADSIMGQGILSRIVLVYGEQRQRLTIPPPYEPSVRNEILGIFRYLREQLKGPILLKQSEYNLLDAIYNSWKYLPDSRLNSYSARRFTHLLKLCLIVSAVEVREKLVLTTEDIILANTILTYTEAFMPKALGEFGKSRNSAVHQTVLEVISQSNDHGGITGKEILTAVSQDVDNMHALAAIVTKLEMAGKVKSIKRGDDIVFVATDPFKQVLSNKFIDLNLLWEYKLANAYPKFQVLPDEIPEGGSIFL